ncbi:hypothetical protein ACVWXN_007092 [Bradyrhizobium sp. i1.4.4]
MSRSACPALRCRRHIKSIQDWEVTEPVTLATLSFTK